MVISGMSIRAYWLANFAFDFFLYMVISCISIAIAVALNIGAYTGDALMATWFLYILYGISYIPLNYIMSLALTEETTFFNATFIVGGLVPSLMAIMRVINEGSGLFARGVSWILRLFPAYAFG